MHISSILKIKMLDRSQTLYYDTLNKNPTLSTKLLLCRTWDISASYFNKNVFWGGGTFLIREPSEFKRLQVPSQVEATSY